MACSIFSYGIRCYTMQCQNSMSPDIPSRPLSELPLTWFLFFVLLPDMQHNPRPPLLLHSPYYSCRFLIPGPCIATWSPLLVLLPDLRYMCWPNPCPQCPYSIPIPCVTTYFPSPMLLLDPSFLRHYLIPILHVDTWSPSPVSLRDLCPWVATWSSYPLLLLDPCPPCPTLSCSPVCYSIPNPCVDAQSKFPCASTWSQCPMWLFDPHHQYRYSNPGPL